jgi:extracellular factor (EF) 3-hydroxypalmitic acid methyl ester biosynthesis protein
MPPQNPVSESALECLNGGDWALLKSKTSRVHFHAGDAIIARGAPVTTLYVLRAGVARVEVTKGTAVARLVGGDICGEMGFIEQCAASAWVIAESEVEADALDAEQLQKLFESFPKLAARFYRSLALILSRRLRLTSARLSTTTKNFPSAPTAYMQ